jgi:protocatechuate 3,4-dioxygenase, beta subunit
VNRRHFVLGLAGLPWIVRSVPAAASPVLRLAAGEPGQRIALTGTIYATDGRTPVSGVRLFVYHTDAAGQYARPVNDPRRARLRGWARSDAAGRYTIETILPGHYPGRDSPRHIHVHVYAPGLPPHWIDDFRFAGDPLLRGEQARVVPLGGTLALRDDAGVLRGVRDVRLDRDRAEANQLVDGWYRR